MGRGKLTDAKWEMIGPPLPRERGRGVHPVGDNRRFFMACPVSCGLGALGATRTSATASGARFMFASGVGSNRSSVMYPSGGGRLARVGSERS